MSVVVSLPTVCKALVVSDASLHHFMSCSDDEGEDENYYHCFISKSILAFKTIEKAYSSNSLTHSHFEKWSFFIALVKIVLCL